VTKKYSNSMSDSQRQVNYKVNKNCSSLHSCWHKFNNVPCNLQFYFVAPREQTSISIWHSLA